MRTLSVGWTFMARLAVALLCCAIAPAAALAQVTPTITLSGLPSTTVPGRGLVVTANVSGNSGTATGSVDILVRDLGSNVQVGGCGNLNLDPSGSASCFFTTPPSGNYQVEVVYSGNYAATTATFPFTTRQVTVTITLSGLLSTVPGRGLTITSNVSSASPLGTPGGSVDFVLHDLSSNGRTGLCGNLYIDTSGNSGCFFTTPSNGNYEIEVNYSGDSPNAPATQAFPFTTRQATVTIALSGLPGTVLPGTSRTITSNVSTASPLGTPQSAIDFVLHDLGSNVRTGLCGNLYIDASGNSGCFFTAPSVLGSYEIEVNFSGDASNAPATQAFPFTVANSPVVTNINDSGAGSLRDAIDFVNANCSGQTITFNIPGAGVHTIALSGPLSHLTCAGTTIDGYSQPGASPNTLAVGDNAVLLIEIDGTNGGDVNGILQIGAGSVTLRGLVLGGLFAPSGIRSCGVVNLAPAGSGTSTVAGNFIGTDPTGMALHASYCGIGNFNGTEGLTIGGPSPADRNVIASAYNNVFLYSGNGVLIRGNYIGVNAAGNAALNVSAGGLQLNSGAGGANAVVQGNILAGAGALLVDWPNTTVVSNLIGVAADGVTPIPMAGNAGLSVSTASVTVGGTPGSGNVIANNSGHGVQANVPGVAILGNSIYGNGQRGIDLAGAVVSNDNCDLNTSQNFPVLTSALSIGGSTTIAGSLNSKASTTFQIEFFSNLASDSAGNRAGRTFLGATTVTTSGSCTAAINAVLPVSVAGGNTITATATNIGTNTTGWFSNAVTVSTTPPAAPAVSLSTASLSFGAQLVGAASSPQTVTLTNTGNAPLAISAISASGYFVKTTNCPASPATLAVGASCGIDVTFTPGSMGSLSGTLTITSNAAGSPHAVALSGTGVSAVAPITYTISGPVSGTLNGVPFTNANITAVGLGDANQVFNAYCNPLSNVSFTIVGVGSGNVIDTLSIFASSGAVGFQRGCVTLDWMDVFSPAFASYDLRTSLGPVPGTGLVQNPVNTSLGALTLTSAGTLVFNAVLGAAAPAVSFSPSSLAFGSQGVGTSSAPQGIVVTNSGTAPLSISSIAATGDFAVVGSCASTMLPGDGCTLNVTFTPTGGGTRIGQLLVASNAAGSPAAVLLGGTGAALTPAVSLTPSSLTFASRTVSTTSPAQTVTLANTGTGPLSISSITITGDFAFTSACGASVAAGGSCTIDVTFTPLVAAARSGALSITDNAGGSPHSVPLSGTGLSGAAAVASVSPGAVDFSPQQVGSESPQEIVTVSNTGNAPLTFTSISITGEFAIVTPAGPTPPACPVTLAPAESCRIALVFRPAGTNLRQGTLAISTNGGAATIGVLGTGMIPQPPQLVVPASFDFGSQPIGTHGAGQAVALRNTSPFVATITELSTSGDFTVSDTCTTIAVGAACSPLVTFQPTALGPRSGTLTVRTLRDADPYHVALTGSGEENHVPVLELSTTRIGFGNAFIAMPVGHDVTLRNTGQAPLIVSSVLVTGDYFSDGACVGTIAAGGSCTVHVTFLPSIPGGRVGTVEITSNAAGSPHDVNLSGTGCFVPTPSRARFGVLLCGG